MKLIVSFILLTSLFFLNSCKQAPEEQAATVAKSFAESFYNMDYNKALNYCTTQSAVVISFFASNISQENIDLLKNHGKAKIEVLETVLGEYGVSAKVKCKVSNFVKLNFLEETAFIEEEKEETFNMIKSGNDWFVDFKQ